MSSLAQTENLPAHRRVFDALRAELMDGRYRPGDVLTLRRLAADYRVSPMPVREALRQLIAERALTVRPSGSVMVPEMDLARLADLKQVRLLLEGRAAELAAQAISKDRLKALKRTLRRSEATRGDDGALPNLTQNRVFHFQIYRAAGSDVLVPLIESLWLQFGPYLRIVTQRVGTAWGTGDQHHREVIEALTARRPAAARRAIERDISRAMDILLDGHPSEIAAWIGLDRLQRQGLPAQTA
ncbi:MAG: GntR family transcriptional regulator [Pseudomonadota bacterium]